MYRWAVAFLIACACFWLQCSPVEWSKMAQEPEHLHDHLSDAGFFPDPKSKNAENLFDTENTADSGIAVVEDATSLPVTQYSPSAGQNITYRVQWSWQGAVWDKASQSYVFTNNLGYTFGIQAGYVGLAAMQLMVCDHPEPPATWGFLPLRLLPKLWQIRSAHADHGFTNDSSFVGQSLAETIMDTNLSLYAQASASGHSYCKIHVLYTPLSQQASDGFELKRRSVFLRGWYQTPQGTERIPLEADLHLQLGGVIELQSSTAANSEGSRISHEIRVVRYPAQSFHNIRPDQLHPLDLAYQFLLQLSQHTRAIVFH